MSPLPRPLVEALDALAVRPEILVALDFDGVLAPIVLDPDAARPLPRGRDAVHALAALPGVHVALVSGRTLADLRRLADPPPSASLVGSHGAQVADEHGRDAGAAASLDDATRDLLARATAGLQDIADRYDGAYVESKPAGAVFHTRRMTDRDAVDDASREAASGPGSLEGVRRTLGKEVVDLSVVDVDKGVALQRLRAALGDTPGDVAVLYAGDDVTDEHAFAVLDDAAGDVTVKVGDGATAARHRVADPDGAADLLEHLLAARDRAAVTPPG